MIQLIAQTRRLQKNDIVSEPLMTWNVSKHARPVRRVRLTADPVWDSVLMDGTEVPAMFVRGTDLETGSEVRWMSTAQRYWPVLRPSGNGTEPVRDYVFTSGRWAHWLLKESPAAA